MGYPFCEHPKPHQHGRTSKGSQRFKGANCEQTFTETLDILHYRRRVPPEQIETILQAQAEGSSLRGISRIGKRAYGTVVSLVRAASQKAQLVPNEAVQDVECAEIVADELWSFIQKNKSTVDQRH
jgi:transposase-like protein